MSHVEDFLNLIWLFWLFCSSAIVYFFITMDKKDQNYFAWIDHSEKRPRSIIFSSCAILENEDLPFIQGPEFFCTRNLLPLGCQLKKLWWMGGEPGKKTNEGLTYFIFGERGIASPWPLLDLVARTPIEFGVGHGFHQDLENWDFG